MAVIRPFRALRPARDAAPAVSSVPYDVVSTEEARQLAANNPLSFLHVTRSEIDLPAGTDPYSAPVYEKAREQLRRAPRQRAAGDGGRGRAVLLPAPHGRPRTDRSRRLLLGRRVRAGRHQETRENAPRQGRRPHAAHHRAPRADRRRVPDLSRVGGHRSAQPRRHGRRAALRFQGRRWGAPHDLEGRRRGRPPRWWTRSPACRRCTLPTATIARRARRAPGRRRAQRRGRHVHRRGVPVEPDAHPSLQPHRQGSRRARPRRSSSRRCARACRSATAARRRAARERSRCSWTASGTRSICRPPRRPTVRAPARSTSRSSSTTCSVRSSTIGDVRTDKRIDFVGGARGTTALESAVNGGKAAVAFSMHPVTIDDLMAISDEGGHHAAQVHVVRAQAERWTADPHDMRRATADGTKTTKITRITKCLGFPE